MATTKVSQCISFWLSEIFREDPDWTLDAVMKAAGVPRETIRRATEGRIRLINRNAIKLAKFIEKHTNGQISADYILNDSRKHFHEAHMPGVDLSGEDLRGADFTRAHMVGAKLTGANIDGARFDLANLRGADFEGVQGKATFRSAILSEAKIANTNITWDMTGAIAQNVTLSNMTVEEDSRLGHVDFSGSNSTFEKVRWLANGSRTLGVKMPENIDLHNFTEAFCDHVMLACLMEAEFGIDLNKGRGDAEILQFAEFLLARKNSLIRCYDGVAERILTHLPHRLDDIVNAIGKYKWFAKERLLIALHVFENCRTIEDFEDLRNTPFYAESFMGKVEKRRTSRDIIEKYILRARRGEFVKDMRPERMMSIA